MILAGKAISPFIESLAFFFSIDVVISNFPSFNNMFYSEFHAFIQSLLHYMIVVKFEKRKRDSHR